MKRKLILVGTLLILAMNMSSCYVREVHGGGHRHGREHHEGHHGRHGGYHDDHR